MTLVGVRSAGPPPPIVESLHVTFDLTSHPSVSMGNGFCDPSEIVNLKDA